MSFRDFVTNRWYRRKMGAEFERFRNLTPPVNPSRRYIERLVNQLLDSHKARTARKELTMIGAAAVPALAAALRQTRFQQAEVCNGGLIQFFANSSGDRAAETLGALRELGHAEAESALLSAIKLVGPLAIEPEREARLVAFDGRFEELRKAFGPLEDSFYSKASQLRQAFLLYAAAHAEHFR